jgi:nicotinamidase/pyrazinamidase
MRIFYDIDTQNDFMNSDGALYVPGAELIKPNLRLLTEYAKQKSIPVLGSVDVHFGTPEYKKREGELTRWGGPFPDHCMDNTPGQLKIWETTLFQNNNVKGANTCGISDEVLYIVNQLNRGDNEVKKRYFNQFKFQGYNEENIIKHWNQFIRGIDEEDIAKAVNQIKNTSKNNPPKGIYIQKQSHDVFTNPNAEVLLQKANVNEAVVYGVATDYCVKAAVLGMQQRKVQCYVVQDAIAGVFPESTKSALEEMAAAGAKFVTTKGVLENKTW